jgi:hypothetical protein
VYGGMPIVATTKGGREFAGRRHIRIAVQNMTDLVGVFFVDTAEGEFGESFRGGCIKFGRGRVLGDQSA